MASVPDAPGMPVVLDTNVIVSAIWSPGRNATRILSAVFSGMLTACYDERVTEEYERVLHYPKLGFDEWEIQAVLDPLIKDGFSVVAPPIADISFERDESDRKFYEVAVFCNAILVTGNLKHFPADPRIMSPADFCARWL